MKRKLKNFYNNVIRDTALDELFHKIGFWTLIIISFLCIIDFSDKYFFFISGSTFYILYKANIFTQNIDRRKEASLYDSNIPKVLDSIIDEAFNEYFLLNKGFEKEKGYINSDEEKEILNTMINSVSSRISSVTMSKLEAFYNKDMVPNIISTKIYMSIMAYVANNNVPIKDNNADSVLKAMINDIDKNQEQILDSSGTTIRYL